MPKPKNAIEPEEPIEEPNIDEVVLLENIRDLRFVNSDGKLFRLDERGSGVYWLAAV